MRTFITRRAAWLAVVPVVVALGLLAVAIATSSSARTRDSGFSWLRPSAVPRNWRVATTARGARLAYPAGWRAIETDPGTASAAPRGRAGGFAGYLNATPRAGDETLANWSRFRVEHVADEGAHDVRRSASATGLRFPGARGSCVVDSYSTSRTRFREIACIVSGARGTTVVVAAAPVARWARLAPLLERAVSSFRV